MRLRGAARVARVVGALVRVVAALVRVVAVVRVASLACAVAWRIRVRAASVCRGARLRGDLEAAPRSDNCCPLAHLCGCRKRERARRGKTNKKREDKKTDPGNSSIAIETSATGLPGN